MPVKNRRKTNTHSGLSQRTVRFAPKPHRFFYNFFASLYVVERNKALEFHNVTGYIITTSFLNLVLNTECENMGLPVPPEPPGYGWCPECCELLPGHLWVRVFSGDEGTFSGFVLQDEENPCEFFGTIYDGPADETRVFLNFCVDDDYTEIDAVDLWIEQCQYRHWHDNNCNPWLEFITENCEHEVWP